MSDILQAADATAEGGYVPSDNGKAVIKVIGVGGGGGNTVQHMINEEVTNVDFLVVNTDLQALNSNTAKNRIQIGVNTTRGLGSGSNPEIGRNAAEESREVLRENIGKSDIVFITAGMGGGTGTGASPVIANIARKELGALTVAIVTKPFSFEGKKQLQKAEQGIEKLREEVDALIIIPNDKLLRYLPKNISLVRAFQECNNVLKRAVQGIADVIERCGYQNLDFNDIRTMLLRSGTVLIGMGEGEGENAVEQAVQNAVNCPLLEDFSNCKARGLIVNVTMNEELGLDRYERLGNILHKSFATENSDIKYGFVINSNMKPDAVHVTIVLAGLTEVDKPDSENINTILGQVSPASADDSAVSTTTSAEVLASMFQNTGMNTSGLSRVSSGFDDVQNKKSVTDDTIELPSWLSKKSN